MRSNSRLRVAVVPHQVDPVYLVWMALRALGRGVLAAVRAVFMVLLLVIPMLVGELMVRLLDKYRRNQVTQVEKKK